MPRLVVATTNAGKLAEISAAMDDLAIDAVGLADLGAPVVTPEETGATFYENALIKAASYAKQTGLPCLADDSGLEVDALDGAPGVISSHYATGGVETGIDRPQRDADNNTALLRALEHVSEPDRGARFVCVMVVAHPDGSVLCSARGTFEGRIGMPPRIPAGDHGFGYDPLFLIAPFFERTSAELSREEKNAISHRGHALRRIIDAMPPLPA